jgi:hypothetical protein
LVYSTIAIPEETIKTYAEGSVDTTDYGTTTGLDHVDGSVTDEGTVM